MNKNLCKNCGHAWASHAQWRGYKTRFSTCPCPSCNCREFVSVAAPVWEEYLLQREMFEHKEVNNAAR